MIIVMMKIEQETNKRKNQSNRESNQMAIDNNDNIANLCIMLCA